MSKIAPIVALGLAVSYAAMNAPAFLGFAVHADTLYPALLVEEMRADPAALLRFRFPRVPGVLPDLATTTFIDAVTGSWRLGFWGHAWIAFVLLALLGGWIARQVFGAAARAAGAWLALILACLVVVALIDQQRVAGRGAGTAESPPLPVDIHVMLMMPVWQSGAFIAGLGVLCLAWRAARGGSWPALLGLASFTALATASNAIVVAHAVLPALIALADGAWRGGIGRGMALRIAATLGAGAAAGYWLGALANRSPLPGLPETGLFENLRAMLPDLLREPAQLVMLLACLPIALALRRPAAAAPRLPRGGNADALRFFVVAAAVACVAAVGVTTLFYHGPHAWRYGNPVAWWPAIFLAGMLAVRWPRRAGAGAALAAGGIAAASAIAAGTLGPALLTWRPPELACLDTADPEGTLRAGLAPYWYARTMAAASGWRRQVESTDFGDGRPYLTVEDPRALVQQRRGPPGTPPPYRFILMADLDPAAITRIHGRPDRIVPCGATPLWIYPEGWDPVDRLIAMADPLIPEALAIGRPVCTGAERLLAEAGDAQGGRLVTLPAGRWRIGLHHGGGGGARWQVLAGSDGALLEEQVLARSGGTAEAILGQPAARTALLLRVVPGDGAVPVLRSLAIVPAGADVTQACAATPDGPLRAP